MIPSTRTDAAEASRRALYAGVKERGPGGFQQQIVQLCHRLGHLCFHDPDSHLCPRCGALQMDRRVRGFPDVVIVRAPKVGLRGPWLILAELKTERGTLSPEQRVWGAWLSAVARIVPGVHYAVWKPHDLSDIIDLLTQGLKGTTHAEPEPHPVTHAELAPIVAPGPPAAARRAAPRRAGGRVRRGPNVST